MGLRAIRFDRVRGVIRLLNEMRELGWRTEPARQHMMDSLLQLVGARIGSVVIDSNYTRGATDSLTKTTVAGFDDETIKFFERNIEEGAWENPVHDAERKRVLGAGGKVITAKQDDVVSSETWETSSYVLRSRASGFDHFLFTARALDRRHAAEGIALMRGRGDRPFSDEDRDLLHLVHLEHGAFFGNDSTPPLAPRVQETLDHLLTGATDKEIAAKLEISPNTVRQYVKSLLRSHAVTNRGQLIARVLADRRS